MPKNRTGSKKPRSSSLNSTIRLNKFIADSGLCSRRKADQLIENGEVILNGKKVYELGVQVDPKKDKVLVGGKPIKIATRKMYYMVNKPKNVVTTMDDPLDRPTVSEIIETKARIFPVGRLDWDTEGLLLMTNDGEFAQAVSHPKNDIPKTYLAKIDGRVDPKRLERLTKGISIIGGKVSALVAEKIKLGDSKKYEWVKIIITEGKNRQVRRMFEKIGYDVMKLQRVAIGQLKLGALKKGDHRKLENKDIDKIFAPMPTHKKDLKKKAKKSKKRA